MNEDQRKLYADAVWSAWILKTNRPDWQISPNDWSAISEWMDREIPLRYILQAMETVRGQPRSLRYLVPIVDEEAIRARRALVF